MILFYVDYQPELLLKQTKTKDVSKQMIFWSGNLSKPLRQQKEEDDNVILIAILYLCHPTY